MSKKPVRKPSGKARRYSPAKQRVAQPAKQPGVIATITELLQKGATVNEMVAVLVKKFPDRDPDGMRRTVQVQTSRQKAKRDGDGRYKLPKRAHSGERI